MPTREELDQLTDPRLYAMDPREAWQRVKTRTMKKACAAAFRMIEAHCRRALNENQDRRAMHIGAPLQVKR